MYKPLLTFVFAIAVPISRAGRLEVQLSVIDAAGHRRHRTVTGVAEVAGFGPHYNNKNRTYRQNGYDDSIHTACIIFQ